MNKNLIKENMLTEKDQPEQVINNIRTTLMAV